jgi:hypothetical protein
MARPGDTDRSTDVVRRALAEHGLLLESDARLPSVTTLVAGERIHGSWWGHAKGNLIYWVLEDLDARGEILRAKLVNGKVTLIHRTLWPSLVAVGASGEPWQLEGLGDAARSLFANTRHTGTLRLDRLEAWGHAKKPGDAARELERRLLVHSDDVHTDSGRHAKRLEDWSALKDRLALGTLPDAASAKLALERAAERAGARLPWR